MWRYIAKRLALGVLTFVLVTAFVYVLYAVIPGNYVDALLHRPNQSHATQVALIHYYHFDQPPWQRYLAWLWRTVQFAGPVYAIGGFLAAPFTLILPSANIPPVVPSPCVSPTASTPGYFQFADLLAIVVYALIGYFGFRWLRRAGATPWQRRTASWLVPAVVIAAVILSIDFGYRAAGAAAAPDLACAYSVTTPVTDIIGQRFLPTMILMGFSYIVALVIAIPTGIISAVKQYSKLDTAVTAFAFLGFSLPNFWFGLILIEIFALPHGNHPGLFPVGGMGSGGLDSPFANPLDLLYHLALPSLVLVVQQVAGYARYMRSQMLDVLRQDYIRTARAKGLTEWTVIIRHAFRNSLLPLVTLMAIDIPTLFAGAVITEVVFNWPGMGQELIYAATGSQDGAIVAGIVAVLAVLVIIFQLFADILYTRIDPRISYSGAR